MLLNNSYLRFSPFYFVYIFVFRLFLCECVLTALSIYRLPPPASKDAIANLNELVMDNDVKSCPICLKNFNIGEKALEMPCHHVFHAPCILTWLERVNMIIVFFIVCQLKEVLKLWLKVCIRYCIFHRFSIYK